MAKKRQTTGLPKKETIRQTGEADGPMSEFRTRAERDAQRIRYVYYSIGAVIAIVIVVLIAAVGFDQFINPNRTVATIDGTEISAEDFEDRVRFERLVITERINTAADEIIQQQGGTDLDAANQVLQTNVTLADAFQDLQNTDQIGLRVLNTMIEDQLILEEAEERGITATDEEIQEKIDEILGFDAELNQILLDPEQTPEPEPSNTPTPTPLVSPTPSPTPTETPEDEEGPTATPSPVATISSAQTRTPELNRQVFENNRGRFFERAENIAGYSEEDVLHYFRLQVLRDKIADEVTPAPETEPLVSARRIVVETEEEAQQILEALQNGESFGDLARVASIAPSASRGGAEGQLPTENEAIEDFYDEDFIDALNNEEVGELVGPVPAFVESFSQDQAPINGFQIIQVTSRDEEELTEEVSQERQATAFEAWLDELRDANSEDISRADFWPEIVPIDPVYAPRSAY
jgi:parvulin-like peptidyl-prolyl isomerase